MKKNFFILIASALFFVSCRQEADSRYFAPAVEFASGQYELNLERQTSLEVEAVLSRPAAVAMEVRLVFGGTLREGVHYTASAQSVRFNAGASRARLTLNLLPDTIMDAESSITLAFVPGRDFTVSLERPYKTSVQVTKVFHTPILKLLSAQKAVTANPFLAEEIPMTLESHIPVQNDLTVHLASTGLVLGQDLYVKGAEAAMLVLPAGRQKLDFTLQIAFKDESGYAGQGTLSLAPGEGYEVSGSSGALSVTLGDPVVDFKSLLKTAALNGGTGYQIRQGMLLRSGEYDGNTTVDLGLSSPGSNYLRNFRNMYRHPGFSCMANAATSQLLRMSELFPGCLYPAPTAILDYGNDQSHRQFTPADSVFRFVPEPAQPLKGVIRLHKPRTFLARIGTYAQWQADVTGGKAWVVDSRANNGDISASTHPALTGTLSLTLEKVEGTYDFTGSSASIFLTAWWSSPSEQFMQGFDTEKFDVSQENGLWKVQYKLWPR